jgi:hypothetical protein
MHELLKSYISSFLNNIPESFGQRSVPVNYGHLFLLKKVKMLFSLAFPRQKTVYLLLSEITLPSSSSHWTVMGT